MIEGGTGGGSTTTGLHFERRTSLADALQKAGYEVEMDTVFHDGSPVAKNLPKQWLYSKFLSPQNVQWHNQISAKLLPDEALFNVEQGRLYIIEKKWQQVSGSVDEKLQTCSFKLRQYRKLVAPLQIEVSYFYVINDWFRQHRYSDVLQYISDSECEYFYDEIPLNKLGLN